MVTAEDFTQVNFGVWFYKEYIYQRHRGFQNGSYACKRGNDVLVINSKEVIDVDGFDDALKIINDRENAPLEGEQHG